MKQDRVLIFDTTLRDGGQCRGKPLSAEEKLGIAGLLAELKVDIIEAGFAAASDEEAKALRLIAGEIQGPVIAGLSRCAIDDIEKTARALETGDRTRIHLFISTSNVKSPDASAAKKDKVIESAVAGIEQARKFFSDIEFSPHNATRLDEAFLAEITERTIAAGATTINISDTVGYAVPEAFGGLIRHLRETVPNIGQAVLSVHCHNDLGLAVANSLAALQAGARQVECTVNGIGERAGNASLEEIVMALKVRGDYFGLDCGVDTTRIMAASRLVREATGYPVPPNKAIVGGRALEYDTGIFQSGFSKSETYEMIKTEDIDSN